MKAAIIGNGGRECALANTLLLSKQISRVYLSGENLGVYDPHVRSGFEQVLHGKYSARVKSLGIPWQSREALSDALRREDVEIIVIGPEAPLAAGFADYLIKRGFDVIGPVRKSAKLESSKSYAKAFMKKHGIPTAEFKSFSENELDKAISYGESLKFPVAVKADGLCGGKGVVLCRRKSALRDALQNCLVKKVFGKEGKKVVVEKGLAGKEISFIGLFDGETYFGFPPATDYKRLKDKNEGHNTGGMGCIAPSPYATEEVVADFEENILSPFIEGVKAEGLDYCGFIYFGCMLTRDGLKLLEFNVRMGDPEAQAVLPLLKGDLSRLLKLTVERRLAKARSSFSSESVCTIIMSSAKYPTGKSKPQQIFGLEKIPRINERLAKKEEGEEDIKLLLHPFRMPPVSIFLSGVSLGESGKEPRQKKLRPIYASGGRILAVSARAENLGIARKLAYDAAGNIKFEGMHYRKDIAKMR